MGIYYGAFNATKREWFTGHEMDQGAKWGETLYGNPAVALVVLLDDDGRACADPWRGRWGERPREPSNAQLGSPGVSLHQPFPHKTGLGLDLVSARSQA